MSIYTKELAAFDAQLAHRQRLQKKVDELVENLRYRNQQYEKMLSAQQILSSVTEQNTKTVLDYITGVINRALAEVFPFDKPRIYLEHSLHRGLYAHIDVRLETADGHKRDLIYQTGTGLRQIVSFLFQIALIEIRGGRRIIIMDELLSGLHLTAKKIIMQIMKIFADDGFQFIMVEYQVDDFGKMYLVEKPDKIAHITPLDGKYLNQIFIDYSPAVDFDASVTENVTDEG